MAASLGLRSRRNPYRETGRQVRKTGSAGGRPVRGAQRAAPGGADRRRLAHSLYRRALVARPQSPPCATAAARAARCKHVASRACSLFSCCALPDAARGRSLTRSGQCHCVRTRVRQPALISRAPDTPTASIRGPLQQPLRLCLPAAATHGKLTASATRACVGRRLCVSRRGPAALVARPLRPPRSLAEHSACASCGAAT